MRQATVQVRIEERAAGRIAHVTLDNSTRLNCLSSALILELAAAFRKLAGDDALRAVVLTGAGDKAFIGGADLNELGAADPDAARLFITRLHQACAAIRECPVPVIGRVNGFCLGAGLEVAASCDMRIAADGARFGMPEVHMGLPSVIEAALLPGLIGWGRTREMLLTGVLYSAAEARDIGFVQKVAALDALEEAMQPWLDGILRATPQAVRAQKALMARWEKASLEEGIYAGIDALSDAYKTGEPQSAISAFFAAKRKN
ncbi:MAG: enoyl-CoA hydratase [Hyphomicrobiaceae bacterium]|nr:enoyl-CoA hydratase [Hyphomicrobiaceae bacterium]